jgi:hypothetical protein
MKMNEELKTLKASASASGGDLTEMNALKVKITDCEIELTAARKTLAENSVEVSKLKAQNSMALNKNNRLQKEIDAIKSAKSTLSPNASVFQVSSPTIGSPTIAPVNGGPQLANASQTLPKVASSIKGKGKEATIAASGVNTPELSTTPAAVSVDTPILTPVSVNTPPPTTTDAEEAAVSTPVASGDTEMPTDVDELAAPVPEAASVSTPLAAAEADAELAMEEEATDAEINKDIAEESAFTSETVLVATEVEEHDELNDETQVEVEVHEVNNNDKVDSPQLEASEETAIESTEALDDNSKNTDLVDSPVVVQVDVSNVPEATEEEPAADVTESNVETQVEEETLDPAIGSKRKERPDEEGEEGELTAAESPSKKVNTSTTSDE